VVLSEILKDVVAKVVPDSEISVIYNPVVRLQGVQRGKEAEEPSVLYLAHVVCRKGYQDLIKAFAHVADTYISARLILCGSGEIDSAKELCESFGILENVEFKGWVYGAEKAQAFIEAMVFFLPSYDEGLPMSVLEAMSCRILIVATPVGGIPNILKDGENALLFGSGNCQELAEKIRSLFADEDLRVRPTTAAYEKGRNFEVTQAAREWLGVYRSIHVRN
jgi:glycosyltransferase involved in cell wall biosynthesis